MSTDACSSLPADVDACHALIAQQFSAIDALQSELAQLKHYVALLVRSRFGPRSERIDPNQLALFDESPMATTAAVDVALAVETVVPAHTRRGGGRNELPAELPRERMEHDLAEAEKCCPGCGQLRQRIGCETSEQLEFIPAQLKVIEHVRWKYACRHCQEHVAIAEPASKPIDKGLPGPGLLAQVVVGKFSDHLPLYRLEDVFARAGVELSRSTLCRSRTLDGGTVGTAVPMDGPTRVPFARDSYRRYPGKRARSDVAQNPHGKILGVLRRPPEPVFGLRLHEQS